MKKLVTLGLAAAMSASLYAAPMGFGSTSNETIKFLNAPDGKKYEFVICTAGADGSYYPAGVNLADKIGIDYQTNTKRAYTATTDGTNQNYELMSQGACNIMLMQGDHAAYVAGTDKSFFKNKATIQLGRKENVQLIMRKGMDEDDIQNPDAKVHVGLPNSGGAASFKNMGFLDDDYIVKSDNVIYGDIDISVLNDLASGKIDAIIRTSHLNPDKDEIASLVVQMGDLKNDDGPNKEIYFADLDDVALNNKVDLGDGEKAIYVFEDTIIDSSGWDTKAETLTTNVMLVIDKANMTKKQKNHVLRIVTQNRNSLF